MAYTDSSDTLEEDVTQTVAGTEGDGSSADDTTTTTTPPPNNEAMAAIKELADIVRTQAQPKEEPVVLTDDQKKEFWKVYDPEKTDKEFYRKFFRLNPDATPEEVAGAKEMFTSMRDGMMLQAIRGSQVYIQKAVQDLLAEHIEPMRQHFSQANQEGVRNRFYGSYPVLQDEKYSKIIKTVAKSLANETFPATPEGEKAFHKALADGAAEFIKMADPSFSLGATTTKTKPGQVPRLPRTSVGGNGNAGGGKQQASGKAGDDFDSIDVDRKSLIKGSL